MTRELFEYVTTELLTHPGGWIDNLGNLYHLGNSSHDEAAKKIFDFEHGSDSALNMGFIKFDYSIENRRLIAVLRIKNDRAIKKLIDLIKTNLPKHVTIHMENEFTFKTDCEDAIHILTEFLQHNKKPTSNTHYQPILEADSIPTTEYGYWIMMTGEIEPVPFEKHQDIGRELIKKHNLIIAYDKDINGFLLSIGCIRVAVETNETIAVELYEYKRPALRSLIKILKGLGKTSTMPIEVILDWENGYEEIDLLSAIRKINRKIESLITMKQVAENRGFCSEITQQIVANSSLNEFINVSKPPVLTLSKLRKLAPSLQQLKDTNPNHPAVKYLSTRRLPKNAFNLCFYVDHINDWVNENLPEYMGGRKRLPRNGAFIIIPTISKEKGMFGENSIVTHLKCRNLDLNDDKLKRPDGIKYVEIPLNFTNKTVSINKKDNTTKAVKAFGLDDVDLSKTIYVLEGEFDSMILKGRAIAMGGGESITSDLPAIMQSKNIRQSQLVIVYDNEPDKKSTLEKLLQAIRENYKVCIWPKSITVNNQTMSIENLKDINDMFKAGISRDQIIKTINENTFAGANAIDKIKELNLRIPINTTDKWNKPQLNEFNSEEEVKAKPLGWVDKFLTDLYPYNEHLHPAIWDKDNHLLPNVHNDLVKWTNTFIAAMEINKFRVHDIQFKGSMANYIYHKDSDVDIHILVDKLPPENSSIAKELDNKRIAFTKENHYNVAGHPVEFFIRQWNEKHSSDAVYSIMHGKWESIPNPPHKSDVDMPEIKKHFTEFYTKLQNAYDYMLTKTGDKRKAVNNAVKAYKQILSLRATVLDKSKGVEYTPWNLAFKALKRTKFFKYLLTEQRKYRVQDQSTG